jgi:hypothetical protein
MAVIGRKVIQFDVNIILGGQLMKIMQILLRLETIIAPNYDLLKVRQVQVLLEHIPSSTAVIMIVWCFSKEIVVVAQQLAAYNPQKQENCKK